MISSLAGEFPTKALCRVLGVSRSGCYAAKKKAERPRARDNARLGARIFASPGDAVNSFAEARSNSATTSFHLVHKANSSSLGADTCLRKTNDFAGIGGTVHASHHAPNTRIKKDATTSSLT